MSATTLAAPDYSEATDRGTVENRDGWHTPRRFQNNTRGPVFGRGRTQPDHPSGCGCDLETEKGAYRDVTVRMSDGRLVHFYHQSPVVVREGNRYRVSSCGYQTSTTKERISRYLPTGYYVRQRDFEWYLQTPDGGEREFSDGMEITV